MNYLKIEVNCPLNNIGLQAIFCLNLERRPERKAHALEQFDKIGIQNVEFVNALDALKLGLNSPIIELTPGMVGCYESHRMIMKTCLDKGIDNYLVFEDDPLFMDGFNEFMEIALPAIPPDWDFAYLGSTEHHGFATHNKEVNDFWVVPKSVWGTQAFMIRGRKTIQTVYDRLAKMEMQIDCQLSQIVLPGSGLKYYCIYPSAVQQLFEIGSDVQERPIQDLKNGR